MTDTQTPERITAAPDPEHGWLHATCSDVLPQSEDDQTFVRADIHAAVVSERDEADRRAGAAERELVWRRDEKIKHSLWLSKAKERAGYDDNVSFDRVFEDLLAVKAKLTELEKHRA